MLETMKTLRRNKFVSICLVVGLTIMSGACRPSVREVAKLIYGVPIGASREEVRTLLVDAYGKKYPNWRQSYGLTAPPRPVTAAILKADKELIRYLKDEHRYVRVYPSDLYEKMPLGALTDKVGLVAEASEGNGSLSIFYDSRTNFFGFMAETSGMDR